MNNLNRVATLILVVLLWGCGGSSNNKSEPLTSENPVSVVTSYATKSQIVIKLNQVGFLPNDKKVAIIPNVVSNVFQLISTGTNNVVFEGQLSAPLAWELSGKEEVTKADFSLFNTPGSYFLRVDGLADSNKFEINAQVYGLLHDAALKFYYYNRASQEIIAPYAGEWLRNAGHYDNQVLVHASAANTQRPTSTILSSPKGWYDAGDYGKYVVNSGISTYTLLAAYAHFPAFYQDRNIAIPESVDSIPDILNEIIWNLDWLLTMQDFDGSVYHKLTTLEWPGQEMPEEDKRDRYVIGKSTAAALNFAAVMAMASRVYQPFETSFPDKNEQWLNAAVAAWNWAVEHPKQYYQQPDDVSSGEYGDNAVNDEFAWAAAELFIATQDVNYYNQFKKYRSKARIPSWSNVGYLALSSLIMEGESILDPREYQLLKSTQLALANTIVEQSHMNGYQVAMVSSDFVWGSNGVALNKAFILMQANHSSNDIRFRSAATDLIDYILGRNPTDYSFVTGYGTKTPMHPHHRVSESDNLTNPIPGMLVGGPHRGQQDKCHYTYLTPAKSYLDDWCSFSTNEVTINWNAPLIYVLAALQSTR
ncbi:glycoside hydrolase family 9 protein [Thalassotalea piscium]